MIFNKEYYEKTYLKKFSSYEEAYSNWISENNNSVPLLGSPIIDKELGFEYTSQLGQDYYLINNFYQRKKNGFFVEFGACDGIFLSNTYILEKYFDWRGLCIEPDLNYYNQLLINRSCSKDNSLIYKEQGVEVDFGVQDHPETNGIVAYKNNHFYNQKIIKKTTNTLENILLKYNCPTYIDYISIDTEGSELEILKNFNFDKYKFGYISIEHGNDKNYQSQINQFLYSKNYMLYRNCRWDDEYIPII